MAKIELMCPAGSFESLMAAIKAGAGSVYFGVGELNMRSRSANFSVDDLEKIAKICRENNVKSYLALNTVMYDEDISSMKKMCDLAKKSGVSAIIAHDIAVIEYATSIGLEVHMSTQANISNIEAVRFWSKYADVVVLARELSLEQVKKICDKIKKDQIKGPSGSLVGVEVFVHGALCVSISGKCYMSLATYNHSANRGACLQNCRRKYRVTDEETGDELEVDNRYIMSPKDLCTIGMIDKLIDAGVTVLKIEGRARGPEYVHTVTRVYKEAVDAVLAGDFSKEKVELWRKELSNVFNRGFWENGYYMGKKTGEWAGVYGSKAVKQKIKLGKVIHFWSEKNVAQIEIQTGEVAVGDEILVIGPTTGVVQMEVSSMMDEEERLEKAVKGQKITIELPEKARMNDEVYLFKDKD